VGKGGGDGREGKGVGEGQGWGKGEGMGGKGGIGERKKKEGGSCAPLSQIPGSAPAVRHLDIVLPPYEITHEVSFGRRSCLSNFM